MNKQYARFVMTEMDKGRAYERLLHRVAAMCNDNENVDWGVDEASAEFHAISNQITWGMYEIEQAAKEQVDAVS